jgi:prephenate dehydrogenase
MSTLYKEIIMTNHENLVNLFESYLAESAKFDEKGNKAAGTRARKALAEFTKAAKERRKEIQDAKTAD